LSTVFVDRDGVVNRNRKDHVKSWEEFVFLPRAVEALAELTRHGFKIVILTNQAAINRGITPRETIEEIHARMREVLARAGARVDGVFYCPHRPDERCACRKPKPGLLVQAAEALGIDLRESYLIGDAMSDVAAGSAVGCRTILVMTGRGVRQFLGGDARRYRGYAISWNIWSAVRRILVEEGRVKVGPAERAWYRLLGAGSRGISLPRLPTRRGGSEPEEAGSERRARSLMR
jgi:D-glycero-D-manno-heptose 1,7-bisphosphate phosphatase